MTAEAGGSPFARGPAVHRSNPARHPRNRLTLSSSRSWPRIFPICRTSPTPARGSSDARRWGVARLACDRRRGGLYV